MATVMRMFGASYLSSGRSVPSSHRNAIRAIAECRTAVLGGHVLECDTCGVQDYAYHSCRHRSCPKCLKDEGQEWFEARRRELLPVPHFHVVFTVPEPLHRIVRRHQQALYPVLMRAAAQTLDKVAGAPQYLDGDVGVMATLHTWSNPLMYHPHVHCLMPAGSVDAQGQWRAAQARQPAPKGLLASEFRDKLRLMMKAAVKGLELPEKVFRKRWQVHIERPEHGAETVLRYLGRPLYRGPMSDYRIVEVTDKEVVFRYRAGDRSKWRTMRVAGHEFLRRFLQHVWPKRLHKVHYSGLWSRKSRPQLVALRQQLLSAATTATPPASTPATTAPPVATPSEPTPRRQHECPHCKGQRFVVCRFEPRTTPPPLRQPPSLTSSPPPPRPP